MRLRSYLPYKSAQLYIDRGMSKWMGFFISEHTTAINTYGDTIDFTINMEEDEKRLILSQLYFYKGKSLLYTTLQKQPLKGKVIDVTESHIYYRDSNKTYHLLINDVLKVELAEEV